MGVLPSLLTIISKAQLCWPNLLVQTFEKQRICFSRRAPQTFARRGLVISYVGPYNIGPFFRTPFGCPVLQCGLVRPSTTSSQVDRRRRFSCVSPPATSWSRMSSAIFMSRRPALFPTKNIDTRGRWTFSTCFTFPFPYLCFPSIL